MFRWMGNLSYKRIVQKRWLSFSRLTYWNSCLTASPYAKTEIEELFKVAHWQIRHTLIVKKFRQLLEKQFPTRELRPGHIFSNVAPQGLFGLISAVAALLGMPASCFQCSPSWHDAGLRLALHSSLLSSPRWEDTVQTHLGISALAQAHIHTLAHLFSAFLSIPPAGPPSPVLLFPTS